jgi:hypothetical protein
LVKPLSLLNVNPGGKFNHNDCDGRLPVAKPDVRSRLEVAIGIGHHGAATITREH